MNNKSDLYALQWNNHTKLLKGTFELFRSDNELVDVTLSCEGKKLKAHKIVLSACSTYFLELFRDNPCQHPIVILRDVKYQNMVDILNFMYMGEANITIEHLNAFLQIAELLQVKGLASNRISDKFVDAECSLVNNEVNRNKESADLDFNKSIESITADLQSRSNDSNMELLSDIVANNNVQDIKLDELPTVKTEFVDIEDMTENNDVEFTEEDFNIIPFENHVLDPSITNVIDDFSSQSESRQQNYPCPHCNKVFTHSVSLKLHLPQHSGRTSCTLCDAVLSRKYELKVHMRKRHNIDMNIFYRR